ncbi:hypothetical protein DSM106972_008440 [Dulcicalothrix desertica PCC 7102]|uniref:DUF928 domain-containing protein n=1 Tax=Dulcicalothrix desertica PCC 7102 TaxID=232991 RepID=A0A433VRU4_9CYAN|nr:DUF928 domain-containing protein [Dulcicalothrix desertica]RUT08791.1 hypothetical protein DSM106972_008440 [Dulcicalothrix desertica PCC 7102]TWH44192.1 uncharacterized protein DUF928 [Dulcicalothrix desertica PCC 7102]
MSVVKNYIKSKYTIAFALVLWMSNFLPAQAQLNTTQPKRTETDGSRRGRPSGRTATGSRGDCPEVNVPLTALIPVNNQGLTMAEYPQFWIFVPYQSKNIAIGEFVLQDKQNNDVYRTNFTLPQAPGIVNVSLGKAKPLQINQEYQWFFKIYCSPEKLSEPLFVKGWIQRIANNSDLERKLAAARTPEQRFTIYYENHIWYEAVTELAKHQPIRPQNNSLPSDWSNLLKRVDLEYLISQPVVGEVKL